MLLEDLLLERATTPVERAELVAAASDSVFSDCFELHAHLQALLEAAVGAAFALVLVDLALLLVDAGVQLFVLHGALEEAFAALAGE